MILTTSIKDKIKKIRGELKEKNEYRKQVLSDIKQRYDDDPERLSKFQQSVYYLAKTNYSLSF